MKQPILFPLFFLLCGCLSNPDLPVEEKTGKALVDTTSRILILEEFNSDSLIISSSEAVLKVYDGDELIFEKHYDLSENVLEMEEVPLGEDLLFVLTLFDEEGKESARQTRVMSVGEDGISELTFSFYSSSLSSSSSVPASSFEMSSSSSPLQAVKGFRILVDEDAQGKNDGTSWEDAFLRLQDALSIADSGQSIWVHEGRYSLTGTDTAFYLPPYVTLYGDIIDYSDTLHQTSSTWHTTSLNGAHFGAVLIAEEGSTVQGFQLENGNSLFGGGYKLVGGTATLRNVTLMNNNADKQGGGIYLDNATLTMSGVRIENNQTQGDGGGLFAKESRILAGDLVFYNNQAESQGGGVHLLNTTFMVNQIVIDANSNTGGLGGGLFIQIGIADSVSMTNCIISLNSAAEGGGIYNNLSDKVKLRFCTIYKNTATSSGGFAYLNQSEITLKQSILAAQSGAQGSKSYRMVGGVINMTQVLFEEPEEVSIVLSGVENLDSMYYGAPNFVITVETSVGGTDRKYGTADDGLLLKSGSPAIAAGFYNSALPRDLAGNTRSDPTTLGAYEYQAP